MPADAAILIPFNSKGLTCPSAENAKIAADPDAARRHIESLEEAVQEADNANENLALMLCAARSDRESALRDLDMAWAAQARERHALIAVTALASSAVTAVVVAALVLVVQHLVGG